MCFVQKMFWLNWMKLQKKMDDKIDTLYTCRMKNTPADVFNRALKLNCSVILRTCSTNLKGQQMLTDQRRSTRRVSWKQKNKT